jgi:tetratricopeptide (TPR) repeat protein
MSELGEVKRKVAEFEAKGDVKKAIAELEKAVQEFTSEGSLFNKLGDLYIKVNRQEEALDIYEQGAQVFKEETYFPNAIALCKKILRLSKDRISVYALLGELHKELDQRGEAANYFLEYAERKMKENEFEDALTAYKTIKELVPNNPKILETISAIYDKIGKKEEGEELRKEAHEIESKQEKIKEQISAKEVKKPARETPAEQAVEENKVEEELVIEEIVEEPKIEEERAEEKLIEEEEVAEEKIPEEEIPLEDFVSPEVAELLKDDDRSSVGEIDIERPAAAMSEVDKTIELGELYLNLGSEDEAIDCFRGAADEAWSTNDGEKAMTLNKRIAELRPFDLESRKQMVEIARKNGDTELQVESMLNLAEALNRRDAKSEARMLYQKIVELDPENAVAKEMLAAYEQPQDFIDLGAVLRTELDKEKKSDSLQSIEGLISQFRKEVFESIGEGDFRSRYDLGVAYKGMGLFQEAIEEFEIAAKDPDLKLKAMEMIGSCFLERDKVDDAIRILSEGLKITNRPHHEYFGIYFLLGNCHEQQNNMKEALQSYLNACKIDKTVPELTKKIADLKQKLTNELAKRGKKVTPPVRQTTTRKAQPSPGADKKKGKKSKITYL